MHRVGMGAPPSLVLCIQTKCVFLKSPPSAPGGHFCDEGWGVHLPDSRRRKEDPPLPGFCMITNCSPNAYPCARSQVSKEYLSNERNQRRSARVRPRSSVEWVSITMVSFLPNMFYGVSANSAESQKIFCKY